MSECKNEIEENEFDSQPVGKLLLRLALPSVAAQIVNLLYNIVDRMFIGRMPGIGSNALAGLGIALPVITVIEAFAMLIGSGGAPLAAIAMGKKDGEEAERILNICWQLLVGIAAVLIVVLFFCSEPLLMLLGADGETLPYANTYLRIYILGTVFVMFSLGLNSFLVTQGFNKISMRNVCIGAVLNIVLDPLFIYGFHLGIAGAAVATIISQGVTALLVLGFLLGKQTKLRLRWTPLQLRLIGKIAELGISSFFMYLTEGVLQSVFYKQLTIYGNNDYVTAMSIMFSANQVLVRLCQGISEGAQPIISYNFGAGNTRRYQEATRLLVGAGEVVSISIVLLVELFPRAVLGIFTTDAVIITLGASCLRLYLAGRVLAGIQLGLQNMFRAIGYSKTAIYNAAMRKVVLIVPLALILPRLWGLGTTGVFLAESVSDVLAAINTALSYVVIRKGIYRRLEENRLIRERHIQAQV